MRHILIIAQETNQLYINQLMSALGTEIEADVISGTSIFGDRIRWVKSPEHDPGGYISRLKCWFKHFIFIKSWMSNKDLAYDLIFAVSNPPINSYIGLKLKKRFKAPFVYMNWDIYPQIIEKSISSKIVRIPCSLWRKWNTRHYPKIDCMITIGARMAKEIKNATKSKVNLSVIPLGIDQKYLKPIEKEENIFLKNNHLEKKFVILFSGKMGLGHNIELILQAAKKLSNTKEIVFVFIGNGPKYQVIEKFQKKNKLENVKLFPWQEKEIYPFSIACGDIAIVTEEKAVEGLMLPSRVFSMMSCGEAIIGICGRNDDLYGLIEDNEIGICITNDNVDELVDSITKLYEDKNLLKGMQERARYLIESKYAIERVTEKYRELFNEIEDERK